MCLALTRCRSSSKPWLKARIDAMFRVGRNENVSADVHPSAGTLLQRDHGQTIQEVVQHLLPLLGCLRRDAIADLRRWAKDAAVVADLRQSTKPTDGGCCAEGKQVAVIYRGGEPGRAQRVKAEVLVKVQREAIRA